MVLLLHYTLHLTIHVKEIYLHENEIYMLH